MRGIEKAVSEKRIALFSSLAIKILASSLFLPICAFSPPIAKAEIISDETTNTTVIPNGNNFTITNGTRIGNNLFHSFSKFSVPNKGLAFFSNAAEIKNIFSRVTGGNISHIDGLIGTNGKANLFFINPTGIIFGENAVLNVGGSFIASTADSILFEDTTSFSATEGNTPPLLTISIPTGLQTGANPGKIEVQGPGHNLIVDPTTGIIDASNRPLGLLALPDQTLALIGSKVSMEGGNITGFGGRIEIGSISADETITLNPSNSGFVLGYESIGKFEDINITQASSVFNTNSGEIQIQGKQITITDASPVTASTQNDLPGGSIYVHASESLTAITSKTNIIPSGLFAIVFAGASGNGGNVEVKTEDLRLVGGGQITANSQHI
ncbi:hypothetical protein BC008_04360 [Mastigocoleus testarum BC008]|uniref:Filamentous haemagglutinin FhaB/tRNA nuclease CdiA-like TPS domain-containing protein n=2 Tax=Mastigocoleus TaxID=996924 RepID=A0A0V7ZYY9_9CYAN|nr:hypothetical protein BC008_04130 [Mastigocoleus testarum BC008]KST69540.1 hypothetical protein BC008_04360 [Mastigocoleus testarum BC008]